MGTYLPFPIKSTTLKYPFRCNHNRFLFLNGFGSKLNCLSGCHTEQIACTIGKHLPSTGTLCFSPFTAILNKEKSSIDSTPVPTKTPQKSFLFLGKEDLSTDADKHELRKRIFRRNFYLMEQCVRTGLWEQGTMSVWTGSKRMMSLSH